MKIFIYRDEFSKKTFPTQIYVSTLYINNEYMRQGMQTGHLAYNTPEITEKSPIYN